MLWEQILGAVNNPQILWTAAFLALDYGSASNALATPYFMLWKPPWNAYPVADVIASRATCPLRMDGDSYQGIATLIPDRAIFDSHATAGCAEPSSCL